MQHEESELELQASGEFHEVTSLLNDHIRQFMTTNVTFDSHEQLLWAGTQSGHITSYYGSSFYKYTAFQAHHNPVRQILTDAHGLLSLAPNEVRYTTKQGLKIFAAQEESMTNMHCMMRGDGVGNTYVLLAGEQEHFYELDLSIGEIYCKRDVEVEPTTAMMKYTGRLLACGQTTGQVLLRDPNTFEVVKQLDAHSSSLSSFDIAQNLLVTCGFSSRYGHLAVDPYLMVYDLRTMRAFTPAQLPIEPYMVKFMPTFTLRCMAVSQAGQFLLCQPESLVVDPTIYQLSNQGAAVMDCDVTETYQGMVFGDSAGYVHVWADRSDDFVFNLSNQETVLPDEVTPLPAFDIDDWTTLPLSHIPLPPCSEPLASDWPEELLTRADRPPVEIDPDILKNMTIRQFVGYAPNPKKRLRNQCPYNLYADGNGKAYPESPMSRDASRSIVPKMYRKVDIKYSKYGIEDFNFKHYNQTSFAGLEIHIPNAYCNSMLQMMYYVNVLRTGLKNHLCQREFCLACELNFLFNMLDTADVDQTCQASNFLRAFRTLPEASALGLLWTDSDEASRLKNASRTIQNWNRFVFRQLHLDTKRESDLPPRPSTPVEALSQSSSVVSTPTKATPIKMRDVEGLSQNLESLTTSEDGVFGTPEKNIGIASVESTPEKRISEVSAADAARKQEEEDERQDPGIESDSLIRDMFGMDIVSYRKCRCGAQICRNATLFTIDLVYPDSRNVKGCVEFSSLLQNSITRDQKTQAWCEKCRKYQLSSQKRRVKSIPDIINVNCQVEHEKDYEFWKSQQELVGSATTASTPKSSPPKPCRYGKFCNRDGCAFTHAGRDGEPVPVTPTTLDLDGSFGNNRSFRSWLPSVIRVKHIVEKSEIEVHDFDESEDYDEEEDGQLYQLMANVCNIRDPSFGGTLVAHVNVDKIYHQEKGDDEKEQWYVFNDFAITPATDIDVYTFNMEWKVPCVLMYVRKGIEKIHSVEVTSQIDSAVLFTDKSLAMRQLRFSRNYTPLNKTEVPKEGDIVGIDAEFVTLNQEESEMKRDGTLSTLRPSQMSVARITVVRGWGPLQGVPFVDDYISTSEQVVDYLTKFSGIKPGDLDATMSSKHLTTLKTSYQKLRFLIDKKVLFVGHGLKKDFRVINIVIPSEQVVDTVELFHLYGQRFVSLKFLAWHFLNIKIQAGTHDSAEDAYTALKLYDKYRELLRAGEWMLEEELEMLYKTGRQYNWQVPE